MSKKKLNTNDFNDFFGGEQTAQIPPIPKPAPEDMVKEENLTTTPKPKNSTKLKKEKRPKALTKNDKFASKEIFKGLYLTKDLAKKLEGVSGLVGRTNSDLICEALEKLFSTKQYQEMSNLIDKVV